MSIQRFFIKDLESNPDKIEFPPDLTHQIKHVLRYHAGQKVVVLNGGGKAFQVELTDMEGEFVIGEVTDTGEAKNKAAHWMHLFFPLTKKQKVEWILQKGTEVVCPVFSPLFAADH